MSAVIRVSSLEGRETGSDDESLYVKPSVRLSVHPSETCLTFTYQIRVRLLCINQSSQRTLEITVKKEKFDVLIQRTCKNTSMILYTKAAENTEGTCGAVTAGLRVATRAHWAFPLGSEAGLGYRWKKVVKPDWTTAVDLASIDTFPADSTRKLRNHRGNRVKIVTMGV